jgi:hypothetical protein
VVRRAQFDVMPRWQDDMQDGTLGRYMTWVYVVFKT